MLLKLEDYYPIDIEYIKQQWEIIFDISNDQWNIQDMEYHLSLINDKRYPKTFRTFKLNLLPNIIIRIIDLKKNDD